MQEFFARIGDLFYRSIVEQNRYEFIIEGLGKTLIIAFLQLF